MRHSKDKCEFNIFYFVCLVLLILAIGILTPSIYANSPKLDAEAIYKKTFNSVVELKAFDEDGEAFGSAVCISSKGEFITNAHVVTYTEKNELWEDELKTFTNYQIRFPDSDDFVDVSLVKFDRENDLALVKLNNVNRQLNVVSISKDYSTGENCYAVGNLQNYGISITTGIISKKSVNIENNGKTINAIQCDLNITDGNSGGALINKNGELIGITTFRTKDLSGKIIYGISFSIPSAKIIKFLSMTTI